MYFDLHDLSAVVEEAICLGATKSAAQFGGGHFVTMFDTEGHAVLLM